MLRDKKNRTTIRKMKNDFEAIAYFNMQSRYTTYGFPNISPVSYFLEFFAAIATPVLA
jgi:hypothetical protein